MVGRRTVAKWPIELAIYALNPTADIPERSYGYEKIFCPFHSNTRTPAGSIDWDKDSYKCHSCGIAGDAIDLVMVVKEVDFGSAVDFCQEEIGNSRQGVSRATRRKRRPSLFD